MNYPQRKFDAVIFDQDGTLTDTMNIIFQAFVNTVRRFSRIEATYDELFNAMGPPEEKLLHRYLPEACFPEPRSSSSGMMMRLPVRSVFSRELQRPSTVFRRQGPNSVCSLE